MSSTSKVERLGTEQIGKLLLEMSSTIVGVVFIEPIVYMLRATDTITLYAIVYGRIIFLGAITSTGFSTCEQVVAAVRASLGERAVATAWVEGQAMSQGQLVSYALDRGDSWF